MTGFRRIFLPILAVLTALMMLPAAAASAASGHQASQARTASTAAARHPSVTTPTCNSQGSGYCDYARTDGRRQCFWWYGNVSNWNRLPNSHRHCRNVDESLYVEYGGYLRLYYRLHYGGPFVCVEPGTYIRNLHRFKFSNGAAVENDVASSKFTGTRCRHHI